MDPIDIRNVRQELSALRTRSKHALGQNFLIDESVRDAIFAAAKVTKGQNIYEIGPGLGVLTGTLLDKGVSLTCFELDPVMVQYVQTTYTARGDLRVVEGDAVRTLPEYTRETLQNAPYAVVANIPYQITSPLLERLFIDPRGFQAPTSAVLLIQNEVADRLAAKAKDQARGAMTVLLEARALVEKILVVKPESFFPAPKVTSAVIRITPSACPVPADQWAAFMRFVRGGFQQRRKQLKNVMAGMLGVSVPDVEKVFTSLNIPTTARAQELTLDQWVDLFSRRKDV